MTSKMEAKADQNGAPPPLPSPPPPPPPLPPPPLPPDPARARKGGPEALIYSTESSLFHESTHSVEQISVQSGWGHIFRQFLNDFSSIWPAFRTTKKTILKMASAPPYKKIDFVICKRPALQKKMKSASAPPYKKIDSEIGQRPALQKSRF